MDDHMELDLRTPIEEVSVSLDFSYSSTSSHVHIHSKTSSAEEVPGPSTSPGSGVRPNTNQSELDQVCPGVELSEGEENGQGKKWKRKVNKSNVPPPESRAMPRQPKFKDFTLDRNQFITEITDADLEAALRPALVATTSQSPATEPQPSAMPLSSPLFLLPSYSAREDFYFSVGDPKNSTETGNYAQKSWEENPVDTLKLIAHLRDIEDGKGIRSQYQQCLYWLYENHPRTLYNNLPELLKFGYWKDCLQMLMTIAFGGFTHPHLHWDDAGAKPEKVAFLKSLKRKRKIQQVPARYRHPIVDFAEKEKYNNLIARHYGLRETTMTQPRSISDMHKLRLDYAREMFQTNVKYRVFHVRVAQLFAKQLHQDLSNIKQDELKAKKEKTVSLAGKWAPSLEAHFDRYTLIASTIAVELTNMMGAKSKASFLALPIPIAVYLSRKNYQKEFCAPLRKFHQVPEVALSAREWDLVNYSRVPSKCLERNIKSFSQHDRERFTEFTLKSQKWKSPLGPVMMPYEMIPLSMQTESMNPVKEQLIEDDWAQYISEVKTIGCFLNKTIPICDLSGLMDGESMCTDLGLTLMTMSMCDEPWSYTAITFHQEPSFYTVRENEPLKEKVKSLKNVEWGDSTDLQKTFELLLSKALEINLRGDQIPTALLFFTELEFSRAFPGMTFARFGDLKKQFTEKGFVLPGILLWNLRAGDPKNKSPVQVNEYGAILITGYSQELLTYMMVESDISKLTPLHFVLEKIAKDKYQDLVLWD